MDASPRLDEAPLAASSRAVREATHELANAATHGLGALAALIGGGVLVTLAAMHGDGWQLAGAIAFSTGLLLLYVASTLYHAASDPIAKARLKIFDHCAIYLLIAGTYTPFTLVSLRGSSGSALFIAIWVLAAVGIAFKLVFTGRFKRISTAVYVAMGWLALVAIGPLMRALDGATLAWLVIGGLAYTLGTVFYLRNSRFSHAVWHLFCIAGSGAHYVAVLRVVAGT